MNRTTKRNDQLVPKLCGADVELGNLVLGVERHNGTGAEASRLVLAEFEGAEGRASAFRSYDGYGFDSQDWGRKWLASNGGCAYIDLCHLEICQPEVLSARDHVAAWHAMLRLANDARVRADARLAEGHAIDLMANNSDGMSNSFGSHLNFLVSRRLWENICSRKPHYMMFLAAYQVSSLVLFGQGKVGSENGRPAVPYQISQRADFFETLLGVQTTHNRPIINSRDESHCGLETRGSIDRARGSIDRARLHVIFYDSNLCHVACLLKAGVMQLILTLMESERIDPTLFLEDPVEACVEWSHDTSLRKPVRLVSGARRTAVELQLEFLDRVRPMVDSGACEGIVPGAGEILTLWESTLLALQKRDFGALMGRLDWVLKFLALENSIAEHRGLSWESPKVKHLDHLYSNLNPAKGLYWAFERRGLAERIVSESSVAHLTRNPPDNTRAWARAHLLRSFPPEKIHGIDWDRITIRRPGDHFGASYESIILGDPLDSHRAALNQQDGATTDAGGPPRMPDAALSPLIPLPELTKSEHLYARTDTRTEEHEHV